LSCRSKRTELTVVQFREVAVHAAKKKQSILFLPCHKSHIDYLTVSWLSYRLGLSLPHIVAGANLNMPVVGGWLQNCGAFFIRRSFGDDALYPVVVKGQSLSRSLQNRN
jgi:glycerol-3-phosphate O-acyltransferase